METQTTPRSLVRKLSEVMAAVSHVPKTGRNNFHNYDYATEADITAAVRQEMAKRSVMLVPSVDACDFLEVTTNGGKKERLCTMRMTFTAHDGESGEEIRFVSVGQGQDASDKAAYKAATGATKYALLKLFLIPTGDDPEKDEPQQQKPKAPSKAAAKTEVAAVDERRAGLKKLVDAFAAIGWSEAALDMHLGKSVWIINDGEWVALRKMYAAEKDKKAEQEKAEKAIAAAEEEKRAKTISGEVKNLPDVTPFADYIQLIRDAKTPGEVALVVARAAGAKFSAGDLKAMTRTANDRTLVLQDALREAQRKPEPTQPEGF